MKYLLAAVLALIIGWIGKEMLASLLVKFILTGRRRIFWAQLCSCTHPISGQKTTTWHEIHKFYGIQQSTK